MTVFATDANGLKSNVYIGPLVFGEAGENSGQYIVSPALRD